MTDTELVGILRISDRPVTLYAAQRIEALTAECERLRADLATAADLLRRGARNYADLDVPGGWGDQAWTLAQQVSPNREEI